LIQAKKASPRTGKTVMILTGEASGDLHGAKLVKAVAELDKNISFIGSGGIFLKKEGCELFFDIRELSVMGLTEVLVKLPAVLKALITAKSILRNRRPDLLILIDFPEFNMLVAKTARRLGIPVLYYISPKVWAWRPGRIRTLKKRVDRMAVIFPFEENFYRGHDMAVTYVGNPLLDGPLFAVGDYLGQSGKSGKTIALLPGSREKEILKILPVMMEAAKILSAENPGFRFRVSVAPSLDKSLVEQIVNPYQSALSFDMVAEGVHEIFKTADFVVAASGTVTLEAAIAGIPMVVLYKMSTLSYFLAKRLVKVKYASPVNLIAGREVVPELLQDKAEPENIAGTILEILSDDAAYMRMRNDLADVKRLLGEPGASRRVARIALEMIS
jgi:lipid-A-disaccharide synthase